MGSSHCSRVKAKKGLSIRWVLSSNVPPCAWKSGSGGPCGDLQGCSGVGLKGTTWEWCSLAGSANMQLCLPQDQAFFHTYQPLLFASLSEQMEKVLNTPSSPSPNKPQIHFEKHHTGACSGFLVPYTSVLTSAYLAEYSPTARTCAHKHTHTQTQLRENYKVLLCFDLETQESRQCGRKGARQSQDILILVSATVMHY